MSNFISALLGAIAGVCVGVFGISMVRAARTEEPRTDVMCSNCQDSTGDPQTQRVLICNRGKQPVKPTDYCPFWNEKKI